MSKIFIDLEFTRLHQATTPISIGMVSEDGTQQFYAEFTDYAQNQVDDWLEENVLSLLTLTQHEAPYCRVDGNYTEIKGTVPYVMTAENGMIAWLEQLNYSSITVSSYGHSYDFVLFREFFKTAQCHMPSHITHFGYDVATLFQNHGQDPNAEGAKEQFVDEPGNLKHNALFDAQIAQKIYHKILHEQRL